MYALSGPRNSRSGFSLMSMIASFVVLGFATVMMATMLKFSNKEIFKVEAISLIENNHYVSIQTLKKNMSKKLLSLFLTSNALKCLSGDEDVSNLNCADTFNVVQKAGKATISDFIDLSLYTEAQMETNLSSLPAFEYYTSAEIDAISSVADKALVENYGKVFDSKRGFNLKSVSTSSGGIKDCNNSSDCSYYTESLARFDLVDCESSATINICKGIELIFITRFRSETLPFRNQVPRQVSVIKMPYFAAVGIEKIAKGLATCLSGSIKGVAFSGEGIEYECTDSFVDSTVCDQESAYLSLLEVGTNGAHCSSININRLQNISDQCLASSSEVPVPSGDTEIALRRFSPFVEASASTGLGKVPGVDPAFTWSDGANPCEAID